MKIKVILPRRIYGANGQDMNGKTLVLNSEPPAGWAGAYQVVEEPKKADAEPVTNPTDKKAEEPKKADDKK